MAGVMRAYILVKLSRFTLHRPIVAQAGQEFNEFANEKWLISFEDIVAKYVARKREHWGTENN